MGHSKNNSDAQMELFDLWTDFDDFYCATLEREARSVKARVLEARKAGREDFAVHLDEWANTLLSWKAKHETRRPK
jgi:hypothetical protein